MKGPLVRGALGSLALNAGARLLMLASGVLLARLLGPEGYGAYAAAIAAVVLLAALGGLGVPTLLVRMVGAYDVRAEWGLLRGLLRAGGGAVLAATIALSLGGAALLYATEPSPGREALWAALVLLPLLALNSVRSGALRGLNRVLLAQLPECVAMPALLLAALWLWPPASAAGAVALRAAATAGAFALGSLLLARALAQRVPPAAPSRALRGWAASAGPLYFIAVLSVVNLQADVLILAALRGPESAGVYHAAARGAELVAFALLMANFALQPLISRLHAAGKLEELQRAVTFTARATLAAALPAALLLALFAEPLLRTVFGAGFERGAACLVILCFAQVFHAAMGSVDHLLSMTGHERDAAWGLGLAAACNVALNALLVPRWDIEGAAVASALSLAVWNVLLSLKVRRRLGIASDVLGRARVRHA